MSVCLFIEMNYGRTGTYKNTFYSELTVFNRKDVNNDITALVLSVMLYWHSLDKHQRFNGRNHVYLLARNLRVNPEAVKEALEYLTSLKLLDKRNEVITTESENPDKKTKLNEFYVLNFHNLHEELKKHSLNIPVKILRMASDDFFDLYSYISPLRLPKVQGLVGMIKGEAYDIAALNACKIICSICSEPEFEDFSYKALAPGWRMLAQPPARAEDLVERYKRKVKDRWISILLTALSLCQMVTASALKNIKYGIQENRWSQEFWLLPSTFALQLFQTELNSIQISILKSFLKDLSFYTDLQA